MTAERTTVPNKADERAESFMGAAKLRTKITPKGRVCPPNDPDCKKGKHKHGLMYFVLLQRTADAPDLIQTASGIAKKRPKWGCGFDYWLPEGVSYPSTLEILRFVKEAISWPTTADEVFDVTGGTLRPSECIARASLSERFSKFLTGDEMDTIRKL